jgi:glycosidase
LENSNYKTGKPDKDSYKRLQLYLIHLFTTLGAPQIWNGEEMGMWGADDPFGRKPLCWKDMKFKSENRNNIQALKPEYDKVGFNETTFQFYKKLIKMRKENPELVDGELKFIITDGKKLAYERSLNGNKILVLFNASDSPQQFNIPTGKYSDLITGKTIIASVLKLSAIQAVVLKQN